MVKDVSKVNGISAIRKAQLRVVFCMLDWREGDRKQGVKTSPVVFIDDRIIAFVSFLIVFRVSTEILN